MKHWTGIRRYGCGLAAIFGVLMVLTPICGDVQASEKHGGVLRVGLPGDLTTLEPHMSTSAMDRHLYFAIYNTLVGLDPELGIMPELATAWGIPDRQTYLFTRQRGVKFHDGADWPKAPCNAGVSGMEDHAPRSDPAGASRCGARPAGGWHQLPWRGGIPPTLE
jgi:ABC-type transport system substrate-binding protein